MTSSKNIRKLILISLLFSICFMMACNIDNTNVKNGNKDGYEDKKDISSISSNEIYANLSEDSVIETINNYYVDYYRNGIIRDVGESFNAGKELSYDVYYAGDNYLLLKFKTYEDKDLYYNATFYINNNLSIENKRILDYDKLDNMYSSELTQICSSSFYIPKKAEIVFKDYEEKKEFLKQLEQLIWYRYFDYSDEKPASDNPIFYEKTKAIKVDLLDFDSITTIYRVLVYTADGYVYEVSIKYNDSNKQFEISENPEACFRIDDILTYDSNSNTDEFFGDFMAYYNFVANHIISCIDENYK